MKLNESQERIIDAIKTQNAVSYKILGDLTGLSTAMVYRAVDDLINSGYLEKDEKKGIVLTDAGKIVRL
jgi:Mn-dependent DtxR family transcriptional regulator